MSTTRAWLLDLSQVQGSHVDFAKIASAGFSGVILKATEGGGYVDPAFAANATRASSAGLVVGAYLFLTTGSAVEQQVALFVGTAKMSCDFVALDFESPAPEKWIPPITGEWLTARALQAANLLMQAFGPSFLVTVYTYPYFASRLPASQDLASLTVYPLWIASYHDEQHVPTDLQQPTIPKPWTSWLFWQWSGDKGTAAPGVPCVVDHNVFNGTPAELRALVKKADPPAVTEEDRPVMLLPEMPETD